MHTSCQDLPAPRWLALKRRIVAAGSRFHDTTDRTIPKKLKYLPTPDVFSSRKGSCRSGAPFSTTRKIDVASQGFGTKLGKNCSLLTQILKFRRIFASHCIQGIFRRPLMPRRRPCADTRSLPLSTHVNFRTTLVAC